MGVKTQKESSIQLLCDMGYSVVLDQGGLGEYQCSLFTDIWTQEEPKAISFGPTPARAAKSLLDSIKMKEKANDK